MAGCSDAVCLAAHPVRPSDWLVFGDASQGNSCSEKPLLNLNIQVIILINILLMYPWLQLASLVALSHAE